MSVFGFLPGETPIDVSSLKRKDINTRAALDRAEAENIRKVPTGRAYHDHLTAFDSGTILVYLHRRYLEVAMKTRVQKWGNSLALRIPKTFAQEAGFRADGAVELSLVEGALIVQPINPEPLTLDQLLLGVTDENVPSDWDTGPAVGKELW